MKYNFKKAMTTISGEPITPAGSVAAEGDLILTAETVVINALMGTYDSENLSADKKLRRFRIAMQIQKQPEDCELTVEEVAEIKECVGKGYATLIVGQMFEFLEGKNGN